MALIVEDGTGRLDAESYGSIAEADALAAKWGVAAWVGADPLKEIAARKATDYMVSKLRGFWKGDRRIYNQALDWPRTNAYRDPQDLIDFEIVPPEVKRTWFDLATLALTTDLLPTTSTRTKKRVKVGPLEVEYDGDGSGLAVYTSAIMRLGPLLTPMASGGMMRLVRC